MRPPLEYGDNFPVPKGFWDPTVPWRFPKHAVSPRAGLLTRVFPWIMLGLGVFLGVLSTTFVFTADLGKGKARQGGNLFQGPIPMERFVPSGIPPAGPQGMGPKISPPRPKSRFA